MTSIHNIQSQHELLSHMAVQNMMQNCIAECDGGSIYHASKGWEIPYLQRHELISIATTVEEFRMQCMNPNIHVIHVPAKASLSPEVAANLLSVGLFYKTVFFG